MNCRRARVDDAARLAALAQWVWLDSYASDGVEARMLPYLSDAFALAAWQGVMQDADRVVWLIESAAGALQGLAQLRRGVAAPVSPRASPAVELERLYVAPPCTGRGLGAQLLAAARGTWPGEGLWLSVWTGNAGALRFYQREGGSMIGDTSFLLDGEAIPNHVIAFP